MTANTSIDPAEFLQDQLAIASPDLLREMLGTFIQALLSADADAVCGAPYGVPSPGASAPCASTDTNSRPTSVEVASSRVVYGRPGWAWRRRVKAVIA
ncbi:hypothetical protein [Kribbella sp. VKM Ac-2568]|uniref:hypothetical protein n=1 Tax=Kribbella sp. VKM Ac-2568 TaxID=2512219 RepID=UPI0018EE5E8A